MANYTPNLNLEKPLQTEGYDVDVFNANADKIDTFAGQIPARSLTADKLTTGAKINGVNFKGDTDITLPVATTSVAGTVMPDGESISIDSNGRIFAALPEAHALKGYLENGQSYTDNTLYNDVYYYNHSKFDLSKFTKVGSPLITDDGIASDFSASNYLTKITTITLNKTTYFEFDVKFKTPTFWTKNGRFWAYGTKLYFGHTAIGKLSGAFIGSAINQDSISILDTNTIYEAKYIYDATGFYVKYKKLTDTTWTSSTPATVTSTETQTLQGAIGNAYTDTTAYFTGSIDLKTVKFYVNGYPVFLGTKTGIDTIKPADYTEVGTGVTITDEGIASGFTNTGARLEANIDFTNMNTFSIEGKFYHSGVSNGGRNQFIFDFYDTTLNTNRLYLYNQSAGSANVLWNYPASDSTMAGIQDWFSYTRNAWQTFKFDYDGTNIKLYINGVLRKTSNNVDKTWLQSNYTLFIGNSNLSTAYNSNYTGQIDLNSFKIYVNGNLIYQPCLLIPYNESSTGSKVVDVAYRYRVIDVFEQYGSANYYTIDEVNQNATLPMGEIYGFIEQVDDKIPAVKGYLDNGKLLKNKELFNDVYYYNHSTFDVSKFTKVGSPLITNDGIASGFANGDGIRITESIDTNGNWSIKGLFNFTSATSDQTIFGVNTSGLLYLNMNSNRRLVLSLSTNINNWDITQNTASPAEKTITLNSNVWIELKRIGTNYEVNVSYDNISWTNFISVSSSSNVGDGTLTDITLGSHSANYSTVLQGSVALKLFSITVNGYPIFSGNKTNVDVVKPNSYSVEDENNTIVISESGIVSGFDNAGYIVPQSTEYNLHNIFLSKNTYFEFDVTFITPSLWTKNGRFWAYGDNLYFGHDASGVISGAFIGSAINQTNLPTLAVNTTYNAKFIYDSTGFYVKYKKLTDTTWTSSTPVTVTGTGSNVVFGLIGISYEGSTDTYYTGSIDLNSIKFYVNGNLVYQACLLIPYTQSLTGAKIVDSVYRDRVIDVYEQFGSADYYTIDENNKNVTLPMGEIYGLMNKSASNLLPDWDRAISKTPYETYTATERGWLNVSGVTGQDEIGLKINNVVVAKTRAGGSSDNSAFACIVPVNVGDTYSTYVVNGSSSTEYIEFINFIPCKGDI